MKPAADMHDALPAFLYNEPMEINVAVRKTKSTGRGVFALRDINKGEVIERCPVLILSAKDRASIDTTRLYDYYFWWGKYKKQAAIAFGYGSLYNHSYEPNVVYIRDFKKQLLIFKALRNIDNNEQLLVNYNGSPSDRSTLWFRTRA